MSVLYKTICHEFRSKQWSKHMGKTWTSSDSHTHTYTPSAMRFPLYVSIASGGASEVIKNRIKTDKNPDGMGKSGLLRTHSHFTSYEIPLHVSFAKYNK